MLENIHMKFRITSGSFQTEETEEEQLVRLEWAPMVATEGCSAGRDLPTNPMHESAWHLRYGILKEHT
jgi:hypothetical protein